MEAKRERGRERRLPKRGFRECAVSPFLLDQPSPLLALSEVRSSILLPPADGLGELDLDICREFDRFT